MSRKLSWLLLLVTPGMAVPGSGLPGYAWNGNANEEGGGRGAYCSLYSDTWAEDSVGDVNGTGGFAIGGGVSGLMGTGLIKLPWDERVRRRGAVVARFRGITGGMGVGAFTGVAVVRAA